MHYLGVTHIGLIPYLVSAGPHSLSCRPLHVPKHLHPQPSQLYANTRTHLCTYQRARREAVEALGVVRQEGQVRVAAVQVAGVHVLRACPQAYRFT